VVLLFLPSDNRNPLHSSLAKASQKVLHLDPFPTYGGPRHSSLTIPEWTTHLDSLPDSSYDYPSSSYSTLSNDAEEKAGEGGDGQVEDRLEETFRYQVEHKNLGRRYALSLYPAILPARGKLIDTLISSGVSGYIGFRIVDGIGLLDLETEPISSSGSEDEQAASITIKKVPSSKGQVFKDKTMSLMDKRKLMKMLMFVVNLQEDSEDSLLKG
jgi:RAB protein geranylgeranyltransferase component A